MAFKGADGAVSIVGTAANAGVETIMVTLGPIEVPADSTRVILIFNCSTSTGVGVTAGALKLRRGATLTDTLLSQTFALNWPASSAHGESLIFIDTLQAAATVAYSGTLTATGGTITNAISAIALMFV